MIDVKFKTVGIKGLQGFFNKYVGKAKGIVVEAATDYFIGAKPHGLKHYYPYRYVSRRSAYGKSFFSDAQRALVMGKIRSGEIKPGRSHRKYTMQRGWHRAGSGVSSRAVNEAPETPYVMGTQSQARQPKRVGWRKVGDILKTNLKGAIRAAEAALRKLSK